MPCLAVFHSHEIGVITHIRHRHQHFREGLALRPAQGLRKNLAMLGFRAPAVRRRALFQALDKRVIQIPHHKICHAYLSINDCYQ
ncbi:hypothetical protein WS70_22855 [Burkholderia mayonis]|uniref:Uncharacterized protein n=1 Tax=Burkholderia mayonis TaxID=1385591 RepID=A0A1B4FLT2_9BURK|nr:hypothetical protein WS70_22855 [Burkholderia mayonis]KVE41367.1 hypothetical protein WS70_14400 [Burkholderia mayonis]